MLGTLLKVKDHGRLINLDEIRELEAGNNLTYVSFENREEFAVGDVASRYK